MTEDLVKRLLPVDVQREIIRANDEAPGYGMCDCRDNWGEWYQSAALANWMLEARKIVAASAERLTTPQAGEVERARRICAQVRPKHADGFLRGDYDEDSTEMQAVLVALSAAPNAGLVEAIDDAMITIAAVRATASSEDWADAADHFYKVCGETLVKCRAALDALRGG